MLQTIIELVLAPLLVAASGQAGTRWGPSAGGVVSAFPAIVGPVLLITALDHGARFAARAANGTLLGLVALGAFALTYARLAQRAGWRLTLLAAWVAATLSAACVGLVVGAAGPPAGLLTAGLSLFAAHRLLPTGPPSAAAMASNPNPGPLLMRMLATALLVTALAASARAFGAVVGGILPALPVLASVLAAATHRKEGAAAVVALLRGMLAGMAGFVVFCEVLVLTLRGAGLVAAFTAAILLALVVQLGTLRRHRSTFDVSRAPCRSSSPLPSLDSTLALRRLRRPRRARGPAGGRNAVSNSASATAPGARRCSGGS